MLLLVTVGIVVATHDLSKGVIAGVILSAIFFVAKISHLKVKEQRENERTIFTVEGQLFFASVDNFVDSFDFNVKNEDIIIDFSDAHIWDDSAVGAIDKVVLKYRENHNAVTIKGLNSSSKKIVDKLAIYNNVNAKLSAH
jgi:sulfate permease, SulP family